ncbi:MAG: glycosyltransferase family 4 protein, partial [Gemmatimonadetes bacterium]|nr:glycosyltransferase family 4 protein [Gemmatimonadota bacterium]
MRVLIVHDYGTLTGGAEHVSKMLRDGLRERGHEAEWFASSARPLRVPIAADRTCFGTMSGLGRVTKIFNPLAAASLRSAIRDYRPDVVHLRMFMTQLSPWILSVLHRVPTIHHVVNYDLVCPLNVKRLPDGSPCVHRAGSVCRREGCVPWFGVARAMAQRSLTQRGFSALDRVVCNSGWVRRRLEREGWRVDDVIWNGIPVRPARTGLARRPTIAFAGRLFPKKGVDVLLHAFAAMRGEIEGARLVIAGDGPERAHLEGL